MTDTTAEHSEAPATQMPKRRVGSKPCQRAGCPNRVSHAASQRGHLHCTDLCRTINDTVAEAQNLCRSLGDNPTSRQARMYAEAVTASDAWSRVIELRREIRHAATELGITREQWDAITRPVMAPERPSSMDAYELRGSRDG